MTTEIQAEHLGEDDTSDLKLKIKVRVLEQRIEAYETMMVEHMCMMSKIVEGMKALRKELFRVRVAVTNLPPAGSA